MSTLTDPQPPAPPRASGSDVLDTLAGGGRVLLLDLRVTPPRSFVALLAEHADQQTLGELTHACAEPVHVCDGAEVPLPDGVAQAAAQLARLAGGCGEASIALVEDDGALAELPAITIAGVGCLVDGEAPAAPLG
jgi:hypothetical protein